MLVGREPEQQQIARLVAGARLGQSGVLILCGDPGIGKTALLDDTARQASDMVVLRAAGSEHESALGFACLHQLLAPALHLIDHIPGPQADALAVALTLRRGPVPERFAVGAAALSLLSRYAEERPLLILVDDAHWLDMPSAETLRFVGRRLVADRIALIMAMRPQDDALFGHAGLPTLQLAGLDLTSAMALVATSSAETVSVELAATLYRATGGNPLALVELSRDLDRLRRLPPELPLPVPHTVAEAFAQRFTELSAASQRALLVAVVADGDLTVTAQAVRHLSSRTEDLVAAEAIGLLQLGVGRAEFHHPLVRSAVYAAADPKTRRDAHRAVAAALPDAAQDRRAWHLSEATVGPDDAVARTMAEVGRRAEARGAHGVAAAAFGRSAQLTLCHASRGALLTAAGESAWLGGQTQQATEFLRQAAELVTDPAVIAEIALLRGNVALRTGSLRDAYSRLTRTASRMEHVDPDVAAALLADAVTACFYLCDTAAGSATADRLESLLDTCRTASTRVRGQMAIGVARILAGSAGVDWIRKAVAAASCEPGLLDDPRRPDWIIIGTLFLREAGARRDLIRHVVEERRAHTALGVLPNLLFHAARDDATSDRWHSALASYDESISLARESGQTTDLAASLAGLAWLQARMGRTDECQTNAAEALSLAGQHDITLAKVWALYALGDLASARNDTEAAIQNYSDLQSDLRDIGFRDVDVAPGPELAEAQLRQGDTAGAKKTSHEYFHQAAHKGQPWALARAHRALAALNIRDPDRCTKQFEKALELHELSPDTFEEARTRLSFGAALRRAKSRTAARPQLRLAVESFERLGARPWADFAASELEATGERARRSGEGPLAILTSQEVRIAQMLGTGKTTKEAAAALFLSPKTVEYHLRHIYQKVGIRSRAELSEVIAALPGAPSRP